MEFNKKNVVVISNDIEFIIDVSYKFKESSHNYGVLYISKDNFFLNKFITDIDVIVFDDSSNDLFLLEEIVKNSNLNIPIIIIHQNIQIDLSKYRNTNVYTIIYKHTDRQLLFSNISLCINYLFLNNKIMFKRGLCFDLSKNILFKDNKTIPLTKMENKLLMLLINNINNVVHYDEIADNVWEGKNFSIFSLRNIVQKIRTKTSDNFIKNSSNNGYTIKSI